MLTENAHDKHPIISIVNAINVILRRPNLSDKNDKKPANK